MSAQDHTDLLAPLEPLLNDPEVQEIMVDGYNKVYVERGGRFVDVPTPFRDDEHLLEVINAIVTPLGRRLDEDIPLVDARLPDGSRVNAAIPPASVDGPVLTIRLFRPVPFDVDDLLNQADGHIVAGNYKMAFNFLGAAYFEAIKKDRRENMPSPNSIP